MQKPPITIPHIISTTVILLTVVVGGSAAAMAQSVPSSAIPATLDQATLARLVADLAYPNSAQRFFEAGNTQLEQEIQKLSDEEETGPSLTVSPEVLEQFKD